MYLRSWGWAWCGSHSNRGGTLVEAGKRMLELDGKSYIFELPIHAEFALIVERQAEYVGNLEYALTSQNFYPSWRWP